MSIKKTVLKYILLKIQNGDIKIDQKIPSEKALSIKFNCHRNTIREIYSILRNNRIIKTIDGSGSFLLQDFNSFINNKNIVSYNYSIIKTCSVKNIPLEILPFLSNDNILIKKIYMFNKEIVASEFFIIKNTNNFSEFNIKKNFIKELTYNGVVIFSHTRKMKYILKSSAKDHKGGAIKVISSFFNEENYEIILSHLIVDIRYFNFKYHQFQK